MTRPKQPEQVRRRLLDSAARLVGEHGLPALTIQAVAEAAGVTKGGLFHHFPSKRALLDALLADLLDQFDAGIAAEMARDPEPRGRFTRAYVIANFADYGLGLSNPIMRQIVSLFDEPVLVEQWSGWLTRQLQDHAATDGGPWFEMIRLATDGAWLARLCQIQGVAENPERLCCHLLALTRCPDPAPPEREIPPVAEV